MNNFPENTEFHIPFIKNLVFVAVVTIFSMISVRLFFSNYISHHTTSASFASEKSTK